MQPKEHQKDMCPWHNYKHHNVVVKEPLHFLPPLIFSPLTAVMNTPFIDPIQTHNEDRNGRNAG